MLVKIGRNYAGQDHMVYRFDNNYGVSIAHTGYDEAIDSYLYEVALVRFENEANDSWELHYGTNLAPDCVKFDLNGEEVNAFKMEVSRLAKYN